MMRIDPACGASHGPSEHRNAEVRTKKEEQSRGRDPHTKGARARVGKAGVQRLRRNGQPDSCVSTQSQQYNIFSKDHNDFTRKPRITQRP